MSFKLRHILPGAARADATVSVGAAFDQPWSINPLRMVSTFEEIRARFMQLSFKELREFLSRREPDVETGDELISVQDGVAHIPIQGLIVRDAAFAEMLRNWFGMASIGTDEVRRAVARAREREDVKAIHFDIDSPGGHVAGLTELSDDIHALRGVKPTSGHARRLMASAAYHLGSQVERLTAERGTLVGSIGTVVQVVDVTKALENQGIKVEYISTGIHKTAGAPGTSLSKEQREQIQREVDDMQADFEQDILRGRDLKAAELKKVADGRILHAPRALEAKLIDAVETEDVAHLSAVPVKQQAAPAPAPSDDEDEEDEGDDDEAPNGGEESQIGGTSAAEQLATETPKPKGASMSKNAKAVPATVEEALAMLEEERAARAKVEKERDEAKASAELYLARLNGAKKSEVKQVLDEASGIRFDPAEREEMERIAEAAFKNNPEGLRAHLDKMPKLTKEEPGSKPVQQDTDGTPAQVTTSDKALAKKMGLDVEQLAKMDNLVEVTHDGYAIYKDGTREKIERVD